MSSDDRRFLFCTYEHCHDGLDFKRGCWRKWCRSRGKFYSSHGSHRHKCGAPSGGRPIPTSCLATRKQKGVSGSSAKALRKGSQYDRNSAGKEQTWYGFLLAQNSCHLYPLQKLPASASGRLRRGNTHSLLSRNRCYRQSERLYCQTSCGCYAGWMCCKLTVSLAGCRCCHRQFVLSRMCIAQCC